MHIQPVLTFLMSKLNNIPFHSISLSWTKVIALFLCLLGPTSEILAQSNWPFQELTNNGSTWNWNTGSMGAIDGKAFFLRAPSDSHVVYRNYELWTSDGSFAETLPVSSRPINAGKPSLWNPTQITKVGGYAYFNATSTVTGRELWRMNLSTYEINLVKDIGRANVSSNPRGLMACNSKLLFFATGDADNNGVTEGEELWITDGTETGTKLLKDLVPGTSNGFNGGSIASFGDIVYFEGHKPTGGSSILWRSDGTEAGTYTLGTTPPGIGAYPQGFTSYKSAVYYFTRDSASARGYALWKTDGTTSGTQVVKSPVTPANGSAPYQVTVANNLLFFRGGTNSTGHEPWKSDGTPAGTVQVKDIYAGSTDSMNGQLPSEWVSFDGYAYFVANDGLGGVAGRQIWKTNGTTTTMLPFVFNASVAPNPNSLVVFGNSLFFKIHKDGYGMEWWTTNGTTYSNGPAIDLYPGTTSGVDDSSSLFGSYMVTGNSFYFLGRSPEVGSEVFRAGVPLTMTSQPQPRLAAVGTSFSFSVAANSTTAISYKWKRNGVNINGATSSSYSQSTATLNHAGAYQAFLSSNDGVATSNTANLGVVDLAVTPKSAQTGGTVSLTVNTAAPSGVALTYLWKRGTTTLSNGPTASGGIITGATSATITITKLGATETGNYTCTVSMGALSITTNLAAVGIAATPVITTHPVGKLTTTKANVTFGVVVSNPASVTYQWKKNGTNIPGATASSYNISSALISHGGEYRCVVTNSAGSVNSNIAKLVVVDETVQTKNLKAGSTISWAVALGAPSSSSITYQWRKDGAALNEGTQPSGVNFAGVATQTLTISGITASEVGTYYCRIVADGFIQTTPVFQLFVLAPPVITNSNPSAIIVSGFWSWQITSTGGATRYKISGLPRGLKYNARTGLISGIPLLSGKFRVSISASNQVGTSSNKSFDLIVQNLDSLLAGNHHGMISNHPILNGGLGGMITLSVLPSGAYTGMFANGKTPIRFSGRVIASLTGNAVISQVFHRPGLLDLTLNLNLFSTKTMAGTVSDGTNTATIVGGKQSSKKNPVPMTDNIFNTSIDLSGYYSSINFPQGRGWLQIKVKKTGVIKGVGRLGDNAKVTFSSVIVWPDSTEEGVVDGGRFTLFTLTHSGRSSFVGMVRVRLASGYESSLRATCAWNKMPARNGAERTYANGFSVSDTALVGSPWIQPKLGDLVLGWQAKNNNLSLHVTQGGISEATYASGFPLNYTLSTKGTTTSDKVANVTACTLRVDPKTGLFSGGFSLRDPAPLPSQPVLKRNPTFTGLIIPHLNRGYGVFSLEQLPQEGETLKTSPILSGRVDVIPQ